MLDLVVRGGTLVRPEGLLRADLGVEDGTIIRIAPEIASPAREQIAAQGLLVFPGLVDVHVHCHEPGRADWEGFAHGSRTLAAGGGTLFADMPLTSRPPVLDAATFAAKRAAAEAAAVVDFALWGGLVPGNVMALPALAAAGAVGFKACLVDPGLPDFPAVDEQTLYEGLRAARALGLPVAVHAEDASVVRGRTARALAGGGRGAREYLSSRPVLAELAAVQRALSLARAAGARLHVLHVSSGHAVALIAAARAAGADVSLETCPHYLLFTAEDLDRLGAVLKTAPPLRSAAEQQALWRALAAGLVDLVASDHSPAPPQFKAGTNFFAIWSGVSGGQCTLPALLTEGPARGVGPEQVARLVAEAPARRFGLGRKGRLAEGYDADFALVDPGVHWTLRAEDLRQRHPQSPYLGRTFSALVRRTVLRGHTVFADGRTRDAGPGGIRGRLVSPERSTDGRDRSCTGSGGPGAVCSPITP